MAFDHWDEQESELWEHANLGDVDDPYAETMFETGFLLHDVPSEERELAREMFFDWYEENGYDVEEFPWDEWREFYENA